MKDYVYLSVKNESTSINLTVTNYKVVCEHDWRDGKHYERLTNDLECSYNFNDDDGWGSVESTVSTNNIFEFANFFRELIDGKIIEFTFECPLFHCTVKNIETGYFFDFKIDDGLTGDWIQIIKENMPRSEIEIIANATFLWAEQFPVIDEENSIIKCVEY